MSTILDRRRLLVLTFVLLVSGIILGISIPNRQTMSCDLSDHNLTFNVMQVEQNGRLIYLRYDISWIRDNNEAAPFFRYPTQKCTLVFIDRHKNEIGHQDLFFDLQNDFRSYVTRKDLGILACDVPPECKYLQMEIMNKRTNVMPIGSINVRNTFFGFMRSLLVWDD